MTAAARQYSNKLRTALIYHAGMLEHDTGQHVERRARLEAVMHGIEQHYGAVPMLAPDPAPVPALAAVHNADYVRTIAAIADRGGGQWDYDTVISPASYEAARLAAGAACRAVDLALDPAGPGPAGAFALDRPPGHHACADMAMGFCLFNNAAVAARHAQREHGIERVLIVDWDVHHGNGTQEIFYSDPTVGYFSTHQWPFYPGTGKWTETGAGAGEGSTCNVPLPAGTGDGGFLVAFREVLRPFARRFRPDLILVSAGYDAHHDDPLGQMAATAGGFGTLTAEVMALAAELCESRLAFILEGGYDLDGLTTSVLATLDRLSGPDLAPQPASLLGEAPEESLDRTPLLTLPVRAAIDRALRQHEF
jgi:acetoin utilization deacetylase AcuC-like enzyme